MSAVDSIRSADLGCVNTRSVQVGSIWIGTALARVRLNCVGFTRSPP